MFSAPKYDPYIDDKIESKTALYRYCIKSS